MASGCIRSGSLMKAGKRTFQAWRKRWFVLNADNIKYYSSADLNEANLLGTIQMVEIQSVTQSKEKKHSFVINTRSRTYYMAAKSDMEKNDWIVSIRNCSTNQRHLRVSGDDSSNIYAEIGSVSNVSGMGNNLSSGGGVYMQVQPDLDSCPVNKKDVFDDDEQGLYCMVNKTSQSTAAEKIPLGRKLPAVAEKNPTCRTQSDVTEKTPTQSVAPLKEEGNKLCDKTTTINRTYSEGVHTHKHKQPSVHGLLHDMSLDEVVESEGDEEVDVNYKTDEEDDDDEDENVSFSLPGPCDGKETYAFDEIKELAGKTGEIDLELDLDKLAKLYNLEYDENGEFPAITLLNTYLKGMLPEL